MGDDVTRRDRTREPTDEQRQPDGAFLDDYLQPFDRRALLPLERVLLLARYLRTQRQVRTTETFDESARHARSPHAGIARMTGTAFQYSALMALGASRLGVAARLVTGAEPGRGRSRRLRRPDLMGGAAVRGRHLAPARPRALPGLTRAGGGDGAGAGNGPAEFVREQLAQASKGRDREIRPPSVSPEPRPAWQVALGVVAVMSALGVVALLLCRWPSCRAARADGVRRRGRASTSTAGRRCSTRRATGHPGARGVAPRRPRRSLWASRPISPAGRTPSSSRHATRRATTVATSGTPASSCDAAGRRDGVATSVVVPPQPASLIAGWARGASVSQQVAPRRSRCRASAARGRVTSHPTRGRILRPLGLDEVDQPKSRAASRRTQSPSVRWCST